MVASKIIKFDNGKKYEFRTDGRIFRQLSNGSWKETGKSISRGYLQVGIAGKNYPVHRLIWEAFNGPTHDGMEIDHINRIRTDNSLENLRLVTHTQNNRNRKDNIMIDELEAGLQCNTQEYYNAWVRKKGFKSRVEYHNAWAKKHGFETFREYQKAMVQKRENEIEKLS